jgi:hypothetical protein
MSLVTGILELLGALHISHFTFSFIENLKLLNCDLIYQKQFSLAKKIKLNPILDSLMMIHLIWSIMHLLTNYFSDIRLHFADPKGVVSCFGEWPPAGHSAWLALAGP